MSSVFTSKIRPLSVIRSLQLLPRCQRRNAQVVNARFFQTRVDPRVTEKYRQKLEEKLKSEGVNSIEELKEVYKEKIEAVRKEAAVPEIDAVLESGTGTVDAAATASVPPVHAPFNPPPPPSPIAEAARKLSSAPPGVKTLDSFVDVEKLLVHEDPKEIGMIWRARFINDANSLCATLPKETYDEMAKLGKKHPMFLLPLPREDQGVEMHILQWTFPTKDQSTVIFTSLEEYRLKGEFATPHTTLTHHLELSEKKGLVMAQGQVAPDRGVTVAHAQFLVVALQKFYGAFKGPETERRRKMLEMFSSGDENFMLEDLIKEAEMAE
ncbi:ATP11 protein-domain-containing protein [Pyronema domesticum]|uniref:Similar to Protein ATP11, mitochondrial acc. no. P32453 n=1 Tax=Pyronema omphalodes (strain CBS 100304) TaxID=1076935 RepID=U4LH56_PYROM|nr:ATP11 protein-domain-containing protein [Pyronema domesticum]CCX31444.1 Similar to Protein ATP11, mitochondrial; acc. no. P32453 [Pyronema omphalodes CBS 100304]